MPELKPLSHRGPSGPESSGARGVCRRGDKQLDHVSGRQNYYWANILFVPFKPIQKNNNLKRHP